MACAHCIIVPLPRPLTVHTPAPPLRTRLLHTPPLPPSRMPRQGRNRFLPADLLVAEQLHREAVAACGSPGASPTPTQVAWQLLLSGPAVTGCPAPSPAPTSLGAPAPVGSSSGGGGGGFIPIRPVAAGTAAAAAGGGPAGVFGGGAGGRPAAASLGGGVLGLLISRRDGTNVVTVPLDVAGLPVAPAGCHMLPGGCWYGSGGVRALHVSPRPRPSDGGWRTSAELLLLRSPPTQQSSACHVVRAFTSSKGRAAL